MCRFAHNIAQKRLTAGLRSDPLGGAYSAPPDPLAGLRGKGGEGKGGQARRKEGMERKEDRKGRGREERG